MSGDFTGRASEQGRVYQATGDMHITENHHPTPAWSGADSVRHPSVAHPPAIMRDRSSLMERLKAALLPGRSGEVFVLHGLGGCGKTAVAHVLFRHSVDEAGRVALWVNSSDQTSLRSGMLSVAADRGAAEGELQAARSGLRAAADLVWSYLDNSSEPWLLVLDNADDPAILRDGGWLRSSPNGTVLVTTRQAATQWWPNAELLHLDVLPRDDAAQVLRDLAPGTGTEQEAAVVADRLGRLPLALTLAGGFLSRQVLDPWTLSDYGQRLQSTGELDAVQILDQGAGINASDPRHLVGRTWQLSLDSLVRQGMSEAVHLLRLLACWSDDPLPLSLLSNVELLPGPHPQQVESALRALIDHSLTSLISDGTRSLRTHGILLESVARAVPTEEREALTRAAAELLLDALPEVPHRGQQDERVRMLAPHALALLRRTSGSEGTTQETMTVVVKAVVRAITAIHRMGDYRSAHAIATQALAMASTSIGPAHEWTLALRLRIGRATFRLGHHEEAEAIHRRTLTDSERSHGHDALITLESCLALVLPVWVQGKAQEAVALGHQALEGLSATLGSLHPRTLIARMYLLELPPGPELDREVEQGHTLVADCTEALGVDHQITLAAQVNYAYALFYTGRKRDALPYAMNALEGYERTCGPEYPNTLSARDMLASVLDSMGRLEEATEHMNAVIEARVRVLGDEHPYTQGARDRLSGFGQPSGDS